MGRKSVQSLELPEGVETKKVGHRIYRYWNPCRGTDKEGDRIRLHGDPAAPVNSREWSRFFRELDKAMSDGKPTDHSPGTIGWFIEEKYKCSDEFLRLEEESTQRNYNHCLNRIINAWGRFGVNELTPAAVLEGRDVMRSTPVLANQLLSVGRTLYSWGVPLRYARSNPFNDVGYLPVPDRGHVPWPAWMSEFVISKAWPDLVRMVELGLMTCQRESDLVRMGPDHRERNGIWCRARKTKKKRRSFFIPLAAGDALALDRWAKTPMTFTNSRWLQPIARHNTDLYLYSPKGLQYNPSSLQARFKRWLKTEDGKEICRLWQQWLKRQVKKYEWDIDPDESTHPTIHGLRGTGILLRSAQGYSNEQISNDIGMSLKMVERYMRFRDQMHVAEAARPHLSIVSP